MSRTIRVFWPRQTSGWRNFNWGGVIDGKSVVHIAASEGVLAPNVLTGPLDAIGRMRGAAAIGVRNVTPHGEMGGGGGVEFFLEVLWDSPLDVVTDITVLGPPEDGGGQRG